MSEDNLAEIMIAKSLGEVITRVAAATERAGRAKPPRLVAVSKTKPKELLQEAYAAGQRFFGENYVQELLEKAPELPEDIQWHFIGHLQSNKAKQLVNGVPNLYAVETVESLKLANLLNKAVESAEWKRQLNVYVQVNTSGEESKFGVGPEECVNLCKHVHAECQHLNLTGLMTIGMPDYTSRPENFQCLNECRAKVAAELGIEEASLELSMGMSGDFESAIDMGSTNIRVGSTIFGARDYSNKN
mmetsp:Transcript_25227/g.42268  ORF Transcript_25227/g.42268 Transcript_25227/m.42268 type:complete len:245 (-) Transcript_25227:163-897(-)|eukprot:CAMPEP_0198209376 /NCGR_PEP_ID=MMETSP1445-20131203/15346_1 /TAXON_ID=36898 /ORGANISM="Pyramimonas sp., Strain CCMP2087" /LENGTH=244 /DNA_ID=CAMNT_0043883141 /DNA_START=113 /DNA_END=847 /DNA_ORIENTATION=+